MKTRAEIIADAVLLRGEVEQMCIDTAYWNAEVRKPDEEPIDLDPDGVLRRIYDGVSKLLADESTRIMGEQRPIPQFMTPADLQAVKSELSRRIH